MYKDYKEGTKPSRKGEIYLKDEDKDKAEDNGDEHSLDEKPHSHSEIRNVILKFSPDSKYLAIYLKEIDTLKVLEIPDGKEGIEQIFHKLNSNSKNEYFLYLKGCSCKEKIEELKKNKYNSEEIK
jgi:transposase-like protein